MYTVVWRAFHCISDVPRSFLLVRYADFAYNNSVRPIVSKEVYDSMVADTPSCIDKIKTCQSQVCRCIANFCD